MDSVDVCLPGGQAPSHWYDTWDRQSSQSFSSSTKGLRNAPGENNCFLNSAVQVFWHIDVFRRSYRRLSGHLCMGHSCIFCALKVIFTQFQYSDQASLQPIALRKALANTFAKQERFQLGHMDDAAECFENILNRIHYHIANSHNEDACKAPHCIPHQKFAMTVCDQLVCPCGASSEPLKFYEMVHYISANALVSQSRTMQETGDMLHPNRFGLLLRSAGAVGDIRDCPGNCGKRVQKRRTLLNVPDVVSVGLVWGSDKPDEQITTEVARCIGTTLLLPDIFHSVMCNEINRLPRLQLTALVCYYGKHYSSFIWHTKLQEWIYFDDATVIQIGTQWESVVDKIARNRYQPLLLIYTNPNAQPVPTETAPSSRVMAPGYSMTPVKNQQVDRQTSMEKSRSQNSARKSLDTQSVSSTDSTQEKGSEKEQLGRKTSFEHRRQSSFLIAVMKQKSKEEVIYAVPHNNSKVMNMQKDISQSDQRNSFGKPVQQNGVDMVDGAENTDNYYTLSNMDAYRRPGLNSPDANKLPLTQSFSRAAEAQRKESFKKGKGKVPADVIRYHVDPNRRTSFSSDSDQGSPVNGDGKELKTEQAGKPALPLKPVHVRTRSQSLEDNAGNLSDTNGSNSHNHPHKIIKPKPSGVYDGTDSGPRAHTPVQSGLATLPRNKKTSVTSVSSQNSSSQPGSQYNGHPPSHQQQNLTGYQSCLTYQNVVDMEMHSRQSSNSSILSQGTVIECTQGEENANFHNRQSSTVSQDTLTDKPRESKSKSKRKEKDDKKKEDKSRKEEKKQKSKKDRNSQSRPPPVPDKKSPRDPDEGFDEDGNYIDRRMVESVLSFQKLQRSGSCVSQASTSSVESDSRKMITPKDNLSSEIPFDAASLDSHKDSGYGSSDRNSSSSTGSVTMNPYEQYFLSRSMIPPKSFNPQVMHENMKKLMDKGSGMRGLEYTQEKDLKSLVTNPNEYYNQNNNYTIGYLQGPPPPNLKQGIGQTDIVALYRDDRNQFLQDALTGKMKAVPPPRVPEKPQNLQIQGNQRPQGQGDQPNGLQNQALTAYGTGAQSGKNTAMKNGPQCPDGPKGLPPTGAPTEQHSPGVHEVLLSGNEQFFNLCQRAEDLMDSCILAETSEHYVDAQIHCQQAIDHLQQAMKLQIGQTSYNYAQKKSNSCLLKLRSLQKKLAPNRQESNSSTNSSDNGMDSRSQRVHPPQHKALQSLQQSGLGVRPPSRSGSQTSMDSVKDGSIGSDRSSTPVFDRTVRPSTDERVPPIDSQSPVHEYHSVYKDRSFETNVPDSNNADLFGTLPRRKTQKSQDHVHNNQKHEAEVYKDFLDSQRRNSGNHSRTGSGAQTPVNEPMPGVRDLYNHPQSQSGYYNHTAEFHSANGRQGMHQQYSNKNIFGQTGSGIMPIPVQPPKIENQSKHTEVGNQSYYHANSVTTEMPFFQHAANPDSTVHNYRSMHFHGNSHQINQPMVASGESFRLPAKPLTSSSVASHVRNGKVVVANVFAPSSAIQTAYSTPIQTTRTGHCQPVVDTASPTTDQVSDHVATKSGTTTYRFKCGSPNPYQSRETRRMLDRSASFSHPSRPSNFSNLHCRPTENFEPTGSFWNGPSRQGGSSQPDLRQLAAESVSVPQRPLTPQVLCSEPTEETNQQCVSVKDLKSRFESQVRISSEQKSYTLEQNVKNVCDSSNRQTSCGSIQEARKGPRVLQKQQAAVQRQRSRSESETKPQPPRPKSALAKKNRFADFSNKPRKSVTFSENICRVAAIDSWDHHSDDHVTQAGYQSDEESSDSRRYRARSHEDDDSSTSDSPVEIVGEGACMLCHKQGVEVGQSYCAKCTYYMSRFTPR